METKQHIKYTMPILDKLNLFSNAGAEHLLRAFQNITLFYATCTASMKKVFVSIFLFYPVFSIGDFINTYLFNDWAFLNWLLLLMIIDTTLGIYRSVKENVKAVSKEKGLSKGDTIFAYLFGWFDKRKSMGFLDKIIVYGVVLIVTHIIGAYKASGLSLGDISQLQFAGKSGVLGTEIVGILIHLYKIKPMKFLLDLKAIGINIRDKQNTQANTDEKVEH